MPFTLAHPALVIPFGNKSLKLSMTALVAGSIVPDFEFFIQMREVENIGHKWYGLFLLNIPLAYLLMYVFHNLLRNNFLSNLPRIYKDRFGYLTNFNWNSYAKENKVWVFLSLVIGLVSHFVWDSFTHHDGFFVELIPFLSYNLSLFTLNIPLYFLLQIGFSISGLVFVHLQLTGNPVYENNLSSTINYQYWIAIVLVFISILSIRLIFWPQFNTFGGIAIAIMGSFFYSWILTSLLINYNLQTIKKGII